MDKPYTITSLLNYEHRLWIITKSFGIFHKHPQMCVHCYQLSFENCKVVLYTAFDS